MAKEKASAGTRQASSEPVVQQRSRSASTDEATTQSAQRGRTSARRTAVREKDAAPPLDSAQPLSEPAADPSSAPLATDSGTASAQANATREPEAAVAPGGDIGMAEREEMIRMAAYERYQQRGGQGGSAEDDWLQAEAAIDSPGRQTDQQRDKP